MYRITEICQITAGVFLQKINDVSILHLGYDSRRLQQPSSTVFFALQTNHNNGHRYILAAYEAGARNFIVDEKNALADLPDANIILVDNCLRAMQTLAAWHRKKFSYPVIGITGSNGKTVVKEWLYSLLQDEYNVVRSPKSFNSQLGVPLSIWEMNAQHNLGIFEAGISRKGEMELLQKIINPSIGVLTTIGDAHSEGFGSTAEKTMEKCKLFAGADVVIGPEEYLQTFPGKKYGWGKNSDAAVRVDEIKILKSGTDIAVACNSQAYKIFIPFTDEASISNALTCLTVLLYMGINIPPVLEKFAKLHAIDMRLQLQHAINGCLLINDCYSADASSLKIALHFLVRQSAGRKRTLILSDFFESGRNPAALYAEISDLVDSHQIENVIAIGKQVGLYLREKLSPSTIKSFATTDEFTRQFKSSEFNNQVILLKGARKFGFENIAALFEQKLHGTVLQINLTALGNNFKQYRQQLHPEAKIMAMVKAFSYGSGGAEIASVLQFNHAAYLGVAYADEGIELAKAGITLPVMVMNPEASTFAAIVEYNLEPVIYSFELLQQFDDFINHQGLTNYPVHIEVETGMNRLGFSPATINEMTARIKNSGRLHIKSVFTHLAASDDASQDDFTALQVNVFQKAVAIIQQSIPYFFLKHVANSAAIIRHPHLQMDMVRLGIGLYGIEGIKESALELEPVATLRSTVAQVKEVSPGESVSYNRKGMVHRHSRIATIRIGYADGYSRQFSNGVGKMIVNGKLVPVIGSVCMDMTMIDITDADQVQEGDDVIIFSKELPVQEVARWINTIPYEIMTSISQRVKRVYYYE